MTDLRYCASDNPDAVLVAWVNDMDMGGWLDSDEDAFQKAILDELRQPNVCGVDYDPEREGDVLTICKK